MEIGAIVTADLVTNHCIVVTSPLGVRLLPLQPRVSKILDSMSVFFMYVTRFKQRMAIIGYKMLYLLFVSR
jgi:hypothetical protein